MGWSFKFLGGGVNKPTGDNEIQSVFNLAVNCDTFVNDDLTATYTKILTDVLERTHGIPKDIVPLLFDNCVQSESSEGLITLVVTAMVQKADLFLVYNRSTKTLRKATAEEQRKIKEEYGKKAESSTGVFISFKNYRRTDMLKIFAALEHCVLASLNKTVNLSKAVQFKMAELRSSVSLSDVGVAAAQARSLAEALRKGNDVLLDAGDEITTASPSIEPTEKAINFLDTKRAYYLDLPLSYVTGEQTGGIGTTGEADMRALERGLKQYFFSIVKPILKAVFGIDVEFKSQDFRTLTGALEAAKTFELISNTLISSESKQEIMARLFDLDAEEEKKRIEAEEENEDDEEIDEEQNALAFGNGRRR